MKNSELNNYNASDIKYFANSFVHNNARSEKFPQPYQNHLYTQKGFEETYVKASLNSFNHLKNKYIEALKNTPLKQDELDILRIQLNKAYENLTDDEKKGTNYKIITSNSGIKTGKIYIGFDSRQKATQDTVEEYKKKYNELEVLKKTHPHYIHKTETEQEKMNALFLDLNNMHIMMSNSNRQMVSRPEAPILPYTKLIRNGKIEYKKISELTEEDQKLLPPPPPPPIPMMSQSPSKELLEAKKKFKEKSDAYGNAMQPYLKEGKGNISDLKAQYEEVMKLYYIYSKLAEKENVLPPPPPPPVKN